MPWPKPTSRKTLSVSTTRPIRSRARLPHRPRSKGRSPPLRRHRSRRNNSASARFRAFGSKNKGPLRCREEALSFSGGADSVEQVRLFLDDALPERLKLKPPGHVRAHLFAREERVFAVNRNRFPGGFRHQLRLTGPLHGNEPPGGFVHRLPDGEQSVVAQDDGLAPAQGLRDALAFGSLIDHAGEIIEDGVIFEERAGVLG